jgi:hypothetical protein
LRAELEQFVQRVIKIREVLSKEWVMSSRTWREGFKNRLLRGSSKDGIPLNMLCSKHNCAICPIAGEICNLEVHAMSILDRTPNMAAEIFNNIVEKCNDMLDMEDDVLDMVSAVPEFI